MPTTHLRACHLCEAICGLEIKVDDDGKIVDIRGDQNDPLSRGHVCPKAVALQDLHEDPDRLRQPVKRIRHENAEDEWETISWEEALELAAKGLANSHQRYGVHSVGIYMGNPSVHNYGMMTHQRALFTHLRTDNRFSATSVDQMPHHLASMWLFGHKLMFPIPDIDRSDYFLMLGANPLASNGSLWTVPDVRKRIKALKARGGKLVVVDPRRTETADLASEHHFIRPGTDALLLASLLNTLFEEGLADPAHLADYTSGLDAVATAVSRFSPEAVADRCGIAADEIRRLAREMAAAGSAICYGRMGVSTQAFGALCQWLIQVINIATGNLDRPGGSMFTLPAVDQVSSVGPGGFGRHHSRVRKLPEYDRELPVAALAEEILTPGEKQIRVLFTGAGNPVLSTPNGAQLDTALEQLDFMVSLDFYINETTRHADVILPPTSPLEHDHYDLGFHTNAIRNTTRMNEAVFDKPEGALHDWEIFNALGARVAELVGGQPQLLPPPDRIIDAGLRRGPYGADGGHELGLDLETVRAHPSGLDLGELQPLLPERLMTTGKTIQCDHPLPMADLERLAEQLDSEDSSLLLIGRRDVRSNNSWMHNFHRLVKGRERCTLLMHPSDMERLGIDDSQQVNVESRAGSISLPAESCKDVMPGVVCMPHGYGHGRPGVRAAIASSHAGASYNDLADELAIDALSGNAALNGVPVSVAGT
jgi:anaerobic selenocysteine-containing dehydrogenase